VSLPFEAGVVSCSVAAGAVESSFKADVESLSPSSDALGSSVVVSDNAVDTFSSGTPESSSLLSESVSDVVEVEFPSVPSIVVVVKWTFWHGSKSSMCFIGP